MQQTMGTYEQAIEEMAKMQEQWHSVYDCAYRCGEPSARQEKTLAILDGKILGMEELISKIFCRPVSQIRHDYFSVVLGRGY